MAREPGGLPLAVSLLLLAPAVVYSFQLAVSPVGVARTACRRGEPWRGVSGRRSLARGNAHEDLIDSSEVDYSRPGEGDRRDKEESPLVEYFSRHAIKSGEIVPAHPDDSTIVDAGSPSATKWVNVKTVIFQAKGDPFAAVMREDLVADFGVMARHFRLPKRQVTLAGAPFVQELTGFCVGTVPPLGHRIRLPTLVDAELLKYSAVVGGSGRRGFHSRLSLDDLLEATGAKIVALARPRQENGAELAEATTGLQSSRATVDNGRETGQAEDAAMGPAPFTPLDRISRRIRSAPGVGGEKNHGGAREDSCGDNISGAETAHRTSAFVVDDNETSATTSTAVGESRLWRPQGGADVKVAVEVDEARAKADAEAKAESSLRVISAAMRTVMAALSALAVCEHENGGGGKSTRGGALPDRGLSVLSDSYGDYSSSSTSNAAGEGAAVLGGDGMVGADDDAAFPTKLPPAPAVVVRKHREEDSSGPGMFQHTAGRGNGAGGNGSDAVDGAAAEAAFSRVRRDQPSNPEESAIATLDGAVGDNRSASNVRTVGAGVAEEKRSVGAATAYGRELARAAGTPTVDAIGGDVHLVALVAGKRSLTRLLHFVDLVPPTESVSITEQTCLVRKAWMGPGMIHGQPRPVQVQLIMGKTLVDRLGEEEARVVMRGVKRGQLLHITGRPTPDTRLRFANSDASGSGTTDSTTDGTNSASNYGKYGDSGVGTYDLVCCSLRMLEDVPLVEPELVGKGDDWVGGEDYLTMDLEDDAVTYVDSPRGLRAMGKYLRETLLKPDLISFGGKVSGASSPPALAIDSEWRPGRVPGEPQNPVCLLQLAAGERTFIVDMLHVCRPKTPPMSSSSSNDPAVASEEQEAWSMPGTVGEKANAGLTKREELLEEALAGVLGAPGVVKVGLGPKADFQSLMRSYPHMPCFRRVCGVVNLVNVASNASSLRGKPAEEKSSLSRLSNLVLGKPLDKSEQCSDWGTRPLSGRQKRYAALDARATLLVHRKLVPEVPPGRMETLLSTFAYSHRANSIVATQNSGSYTLEGGGGGSSKRRSGRSAAGRGRRRGESRKERMARKQMLGVTVIDVSEVDLDVDGLGRRWLGRALPGLTKEGVVRTCMYPGRDMPLSGELPSVLRFNRHQSFVEFGNGYALLMNCGGTAKDREHASGFLDEAGSAAAWYLQGKLSSDATAVDIEAAEWQQQQQQQLRTGKIVAGSGGGGDGSAAGAAAAAAQADGSDAVGRLLQRLADASDTPSSILGGLPEDDDDGVPPRRVGAISITPPYIAAAAATAAAAARKASLSGADTDPREPPIDGGIADRLHEGAAVEVGVDAAMSEGLEGTGREQDRASAGGCRSAGEVPRPLASERPEPPRLVLFARAKGRPFVYCGAVDCVDQKYVWSASSSRLGAVRLSLALREWREVAGSGAVGREGAADGIDDAFAEVVREGFK